MTDADLAESLDALAHTECVAEDVQFLHDLNGGLLTIAKHRTVNGTNLVLLAREPGADRWVRLHICPAFVRALYYSAMSVIESDE